MEVEFSLEKFAEDLDAVIAAAGFDRFVLFGMGGVGGAISTIYAARHSEQISQLILHGSHARGKMAGNPTPAQQDEAQARLKVYELGWPNETRVTASSLHRFTYRTRHPSNSARTTTCCA